jgi:hypothetical protein
MATAMIIKKGVRITIAGMAKQISSIGFKYLLYITISVKITLEA